MRPTLTSEITEMKPTDTTRLVRIHASGTKRLGTVLLRPTKKGVYSAVLVRCRTDNAQYSIPGMHGDFPQTNCKVLVTASNWVCHFRPERAAASLARSGCRRRRM